MQKTITQHKKITEAFAYFLTIRTYATWMHGDPRGNVDPNHNQIGTPVIPYFQALNDQMKFSASETELLLTRDQADTVLRSIIDTCAYNRWKLLAAHMRVNHMHIVVQSSMTKEKAMQIIKCYATKNLKKCHMALSQREYFWARHGSTQNIWAPKLLFPTLYYVVKGQGEPMALYYDKNSYDLQDEKLYECYLDK